MNVPKIEGPASDAKGLAEAVEIELEPAADA
jgi:hypothetical protein